MLKAQSAPQPKGRKRRALAAVRNELKRHGLVYLTGLPGLVLLFLFNYLPMMGIIVAFKQYSFKLGIWNSPWAEPLYNNFIYLFKSPFTLRATFNTLYLTVLFMVFSTLAGLGLALMLNEIRHRTLKRVTQSLTLLPYFLSWIVVSVFVYAFLSEGSGVLNKLLVALGFQPVSWYSEPGYWPALLVIINVWKGLGYGSIMYLAGLSGVDPSYYEAAQIDGATRWQQTLHISLPALLPTIITLNLLAVGRIMNADFGFFYGIIGDNALLLETTDVLDTFIFRTLRGLGDVGMSSAAGLYQSVVAFGLVLVTNKLANRYCDGAGLF